MTKYRTDADRAQLRIGSAGIDFCWNPTTPEFEERYAHLAKAGALNVFDAYQELYYQQFKGETPFVYDLRRGQTEAAIAYVNAGANDTNCACLNATKPVMASNRIPSLHVADLFASSLVGYAVNYKEPYSHEDTKQHLDDLLYIYAKLKAAGLNKTAIDAFQKQWPETTMTAIFGTMDKYLSKPEASRWDNIQQDSSEIKKLLSPSMARVQRRQQVRLSVRQ